MDNLKNLSHDCNSSPLFGIASTVRLILAIRAIVMMVVLIHALMWSATVGAQSIRITAIYTAYSANGALYCQSNGRFPDRFRFQLSENETKELVTVCDRLRELLSFIVTLLFENSP